MARSPIPKYRKHPNGTAFVCHQSIPTKSHRMHLGKYGSPESVKRYNAFLSRIDAGATIDAPAGLAYEIDELIVLYLDYAKTHYQRGDSVSSEYDLMQYSLGPLSQLFGEQFAGEFGPRSLVAIRSHLASKGLARSTVNHVLSCIKRFFRWCCEHELAPPDLYSKLVCVRGLVKGQEGVKEPEPVAPASLASIFGVLPHLSKELAAMVEVQYRCGMRPGEVCIMREQDIDRSEPVWLYRPQRHKTEWRGFSQVKAIPGAAQKALTPFLGNAPYLFPARDRWGNVKSERYTTAAYRTGISRGFERAAKAGAAIESFSPNQLRHAIATHVSEQLGQQAAQLWLWHKNLQTTGIYAKKQLAQLVEVAKSLDSHWSASEE